MSAGVTAVAAARPLPCEPVAMPAATPRLRLPTSASLRLYAAVAIALGMLLCPAMLLLAGDAPPARPGTQRAPEAEPPAPTTIRLQAYRGFDKGRHGGQGTPMRLDVAVELDGCADGNLESRAIDAGGWHHETAESCQGDARASAAAGPGDAHQPASPPAPATPPAKDSPACNPATWNCRSPAR